MAKSIIAARFEWYFNAVILGYCLFSDFVFVVCGDIIGEEMTYFVATGKLVWSDGDIDIEMITICQSGVPC